MSNCLRRTIVCTPFTILTETRYAERSRFVIFHEIEIRIYLADPDPWPIFRGNNLAIAGSFAKTRGNGIGSVNTDIIHRGYRMVAETLEKDIKLTGYFDGICVGITGGCIY